MSGLFGGGGFRFAAVGFVRFRGRGVRGVRRRFGRGLFSLFLAGFFLFLFLAFLVGGLFLRFLLFGLFLRGLFGLFQPLGQRFAPAQHVKGVENAAHHAGNKGIRLAFGTFRTDFVQLALGISGVVAAAFL